MKRTALLLASLALGSLLLGATRKSTPDTRTPSAMRYTSVSTGSIAHVLAAVVSSAKIGDDKRAIARRKLRASEAGTYIGEILDERDWAISHWRDRRDRPLTVWIQPQSSVTDFTPEYVSRVRAAFEEWDALQIPLHFSFVRDSAAAEVHVNWIDHFDQPISGRTRWERSASWEITEANIVLAVHHHEGGQLDNESMRAMALHEIGHLLGLDHTTDSLSIMAPKVRVRQITATDSATVQLLYALPMGPIR